MFLLHLTRVGRKQNLWFDRRMNCGKLITVLFFQPGQKYFATAVRDFHSIYIKSIRIGVAFLDTAENALANRAVLT